MKEFFDFLLPILFVGAIVIQLIYILFVFTKLSGHKDLEVSENLPPVSVVIAVANEFDNLKELLPLLDQQDYPNFEILIADDRSSDGTYDYLIQNPDNLTHLNYVRVRDLPDHYTAKKYALTLAIKKASFEWILFTDADCRPDSDQWIKSMVSQLRADKEIVLGFSKYQPNPSFLNALIRYETFQTATQYLSFALAKMPFMGVGRNLMYKKSLFWETKGSSNHNMLLSGDDDLFVNEAATKNNVEICISPEGQTTSTPKATWGDWYTQKKRHLSVGKKYKFRDRFNLGLLWISGILVWTLLIPAFFINPAWFEAPGWTIIPADFLAQYGLAHWKPYTNWMKLITIVFLLYLFIKWLVLSKVNNRLGKTINSWKIPAYDLVYQFYLIIMGGIALFSDPQKIKWK